MYQLDGTLIDLVDQKKKELERLFADQKEGDIYSVRRGVDIQINLENHFAEAWPKERPRYE